MFSGPPSVKLPNVWCFAERTDGAIALTQQPTEAPATRKREREILDAAARIFHRRGYANSSVQEIADAVGLLKGSLYYYIDSKEDLLFRMLLEVHEDARVIVDELDELEAPPLERLREYVRRHIEYNAANLTRIAVYYHDSKLLAPKRRAAILDQRKLYEDFLVGLIEEAQLSGELDPALSPSLLTNGILGVINWIYTWYKPNGAVTPARLGELYGEIVTSGIEPRARSTGRTTPVAAERQASERDAPRRSGRRRAVAP
ncbi:MAG: TetR family transcriptional regulator [Solirubrobacteraceae bacterium]